VLTLKDSGEAKSDLRDLLGKQIRIRLVDESATGSVEIGEIKLAS
jgi:hypothetical protein